MRASLILPVLLLATPVIAESARERCARYAPTEESLAEFLRKAEKATSDYPEAHKQGGAASGSLADAVAQASEARARYRASLSEYRKASEDLAYQLRLCAR